MRTLRLLLPIALIAPVFVAGPAEASPSSGGTIYMFSLNKGLG